MTNREVGERLGQLILQERKATNEILNLINLAMDRRAYLELGYSSMFDWLTKGFGYSNAAAYRRIEAAKLIRSVGGQSPTTQVAPRVVTQDCLAESTPPSLEFLSPKCATIPLPPPANTLSLQQKLEQGDLNLSNLAKTQSIIKSEEKRLGKALPLEIKQDILESIERRSSFETEKILVKMFPESAQRLKQERRQVLDQENVKLTLSLPESAIKNLDRLKDLLSHTFPHGGDANIVALALEQLIKRIDPLTKASGAEAMRVNKSKSQTIREVIRLAAGKCTFKDPKSGKVCGSSYQLQIDHRIPKALGGSDQPSNLRALCRQHNLYEAERALGQESISRFRKQIHLSQI